MNDKFAVIQGDNETEMEKVNKAMRTIALYDCWGRQYRTAISNAMTNYADKPIAEYPQEALMKIAFAGIKYLVAIRETYRAACQAGADYERTLEESKCIFQLMESIFNICGHMTLRNFVITFPITKDFDGDKWECKDYFYTMEVLSKMEWDKPIGKDNVSDLIWDYENNDLKNAYFEYMSAASALYRAESGISIAQQFCEDNGIGSFTINKSSGLIKDNQTGKVSKLRKTSSNIRIIK